MTPVVVGVVGFGLLGEAVAARLPGPAFSVSAFDIAAGRLPAITSAAVRPATSVVDAARDADVVLVATYSAEQVRSVLDDLVDILGRDDGGATVLVTTTLAPRNVVGALGAARQAGLAVVEYPISGTSAEVRDGMGLGLVGSSGPLPAAAAAVVEAITPQFLLVGDAAARLKLAINLVVELNRSALAEGVVFAESMDLDPRLFVRALRSSAGYARVIDRKAHLMIDGDLTPQGRVEQSLKDVDLMLQEAGARGQELPLLVVQRALLSGCVAAGEGGLDGAATVREIRRRRAA